MLHYAIYQKDSMLTYALKRYIRFVFLGIALFLLWGLLLNVSEGVSVWSMSHIIFLLIVTVAGILYRDGWSFDRDTQIVSSWWGFGPWVKRESFTFDEIIRLDLAHFIKGSAQEGTALPKRRQKAMVVFSLLLTDDRQKTVQIIPERSSSGRVEAAFHQIARFTHLAAKIDRPRDVDLPPKLKDL